jgi:hypothetical protein
MAYRLGCLSHPCSELAEPPITVQEATEVDLGCDTTICPWHKGQLTYLNQDGAVYFCAIGRMYWRCAEKPSGFLAPLRYRS